MHLGWHSISYIYVNRNEGINWNVCMCVCVCGVFLKFCFFLRFRMLAEHFLTMYPNLNVDIEEELEQLKVRGDGVIRSFTVVSGFIIRVFI